MLKRKPTSKRRARAVSSGEDLRHSTAVVCEALERRAMLTGVTFNWIGGPGSWFSPSNWSHNPPPSPEPDRSLPNGEDTVNIPASAGLVTIGGGLPAIARRVTSAASIRIETASSLTLFGGDLTINDDGTTESFITLVGGNSSISFVNGSNPLVRKTQRLTGSGTVQAESGGGSIGGGGFGTAQDVLEIGAGVTVRAVGNTSRIGIAAANVVNRGTVISDAPTLFGVTLGGNRSTSRITNLGAIVTSNGGIVQIANFSNPSEQWINQGTIAINGGSLRLAGTFRQADLGNYTRVGGTIQVTSGILLGNLHLDDQSGSWELNGGTLKGSRITRTGNQTLSFNSNGVFDACTFTFDVTVTGFQDMQIRNGLTLENAALRLNSGGRLSVNGVQTIGGSGQVMTTGTSTGLVSLVGPAPQELTIGPGVALRTDTAAISMGGLAGAKLNLQGPFSATTGTSNVNLSQVNVSGAFHVGGTATLSMVGQLDLSSLGSLNVAAAARLLASGPVIGGTKNGTRSRSTGYLLATGGAGAAPAQVLEVMSADRGATTEGYKDNFALGRLNLDGGAEVRLQDAADNATGAAAEAMYLDSLQMAAGTSLDLNGLKLYTRISSIAGTITGGTVTHLTDGGPILPGLPTSGNIAVSGQQDDWTFFGRAGQTVSAIMHPQTNFDSPGVPATLAPALALGRITLVKPDGMTLGTAQGSNVAFTLADQVLPVDGIYRLRAAASTVDANRTGNYTVAVFDVTTETRSYQLNTIATGEIETPFARDKWTFALEAGQQIQFDLVAASSTGLRFTLEGPNGVIALNNISDDSTLITIPGGQGGNYALTVRGLSDHTGKYSFIIRDGSLTPLTLGVPFAGQLPGSGHSRWFQVSLPNPGQLLVALDDANNSDRNQLYLRQGQLPTRSEFDFRAQGFTADGSIYVPTATAGDWYVLVYGDSVPAPSSYTLKAEFSDLRITSITPDRYGVDNQMTMTLVGGGFEPGATLKLVGGATTINAQAVEVDSFTQMTATFNLTGAPQRAWNVIVERGAASFTLSGAFTTLESKPARLETKLVMPGNATRTSVTQIILEYANTGNVAMPAPILTVQSNDPEGDQFPILSLDLTRTLEDFNSSVVPPGISDRIMALGNGAVPGVLNPGERMRLPINYLGDRTPFETTDTALELQVKCAGVAGGEGEDCGCSSTAEGAIDWGSLKDALKPATVTAAVWDRVYSDITDPLDTVEDYAAMLIANAQYLGRAGVRVFDIDDLWNMEVREALGSFTAVPVLEAAVDASVVAPGGPLTLSRRFEDSIVSRNVEGPFGFGWAVPWYATLSRGPNDDVLTINGSAGSQRKFVRDRRGSTILSLSRKYFSGAGDASSMRRVSAGIFELRDADGTATRFRADGKIDYIDDPNGNRVTLAYNAAGRLVTLTHASGDSISIGYNASGRITDVADSFGRSMTFAYDVSNEHLLSAAADDGTTFSYTYDTGADVLKRHTLLSVTGGGTTRSFSYDSRGRLVNTSLVGNVSPVSFAYSDGRITITDAAGSNQAFFDHRGRVAKVTDARGFSALAEYDKNDRIIRNTRSDGSTGKYEWCDCGSLTSFTDELGRKTTYANSGPFKETTQITDPKGSASSFTYDSAGNILSTIFADGSVETLGDYTASGLPGVYTNRRGQSTTFAYNSRGQITNRTRSNAEIVEYVYDLRGRINSVQGPSGSIVFGYDTAVDGDRLKEVAFPTGRMLTYEYDNFGRRTVIRDNTGYETRYEFDAAGRLFRVRDGTSTILTTYSYDAAGRQSRIDHANGTFTTYAYDASGNLLSVDNFRSPGVANSFFHYTYDSRNRRKTQVSGDGTWTYGYDPAGQLVSATLASTNAAIPNQSIQIKYDPAGNREFMTRNGQLTDYGSNALNQITTIDGTRQFYDADGNLVFDGSSTFTYDDLNRLTSIDDGMNQTSFAYDDLDLMTQTAANGVVTDYLNDPFGVNAPLIEYQAGAVVARNIYAGGLLARTNAAGESRRFYDFDALGSTAGVSDATAGYINSYAFDPFGNVLARTESLANPFEFVGRFGVTQQQGDFSRMSARLYGAGTSRFTSIDPIRFGADSNLYQYAFNAPTTFIDPTGLIPGVAPGAGFFNGLGPVGGLVAGDYAGGGTDRIAGDGGFDPIGLITEPIDPLGKIPLPGADYAINLMFDERVQPDFIDGLCGIARSEAFGTINASQAKQLLALDPSLGAKASSVDGSCLKGFPGSEDRDFGLGNPCANGSASLVHARDPNEKIPPLGFGPDNRVAIDEPVAYTIDFENIGPGSVDDNGDPFPVEATAPAQRIVIADQLSANFDFSSVRFTEFKFGETTIPVADGFGAYHTIVPMNTAGSSFVVQIDAEVDPASGIVAVIFQAVDPVTGLPPDPLSGVLPPEDGTGNGMGYFKFTVKALPTVVDNTPIRNIAIIQFDSNDVIPTNQVDPLDPTQGTDPNREALVTIDALPPGVIAGPSFEFDAPRPRVTMQFSEDVRDSLSINSVAIVNLTTSAVITPMQFSYDSGTNVATFDLPSDVADGNYRLTLPSQNVADGVGHHLAADLMLDFFTFAGDANRDRIVNIGDFAVLASRFNQPGTFSQGDFNYNGATEIGDFAILASKFNNTLPAPSGPGKNPSGALAATVVAESIAKPGRVSPRPSPFHRTRTIELLQDSPS